MSQRDARGLFEFDATYARQANGLVAGVDEVGRGPLAGPVVAAAVIFFPRSPSIPVRDSKQLSAKARLQLYWQIIKSSLVGIGYVEAPMIDKINIYQAARLAMKIAVLGLSRTPDMLLIDGPMRLDLPLNQKGIIKGDAQSAAIAAGSIVAKVFRDAWMERLHEQYPAYNFKQNKGYPTAEHIHSLKAAGLSPLHRRSFGPVRAVSELGLL